MPEGRPGGRPRTWGSAPPTKHLLLAALSFTVVAAILLSSFFTHPRGIVDSVLAYGTYFARGVGVNTVHVHPWYFYVACLRCEAAIAVLAVIGLTKPFTPVGILLQAVPGAWLPSGFAGKGLPDPSQWK